MAELTTEGFIIRTRDEIVTEIGNNLQAEFGDQFDVSPESPDGQIIGIMADAIYNAELAGQAAYQSSDPDSAIGTSLEYVSEYNGIFRQLQTSTTVVIEPTGTAGTVIPAGAIVSDGNVNFTTDRQVTIPNTVSATCVDAGRIVVPANSVKEIVSPIAGWTGVDNSSAGTTGRERESDSQLRNRRARSTINSGVNTFESVYSSLERLGIDFSTIEENDTGTPTGIPAHSFQTVVRGGNDTEIAAAIFANKPAGIQAYGTTTLVVNDSKGYPHNIGFSRPNDVNIEVDVEFQRLSGASNELIDTMRANILTFINELEIGGDVIWSRVFGVAASSGAAAIRTLTITIQGGTHGTADIPMTIAQKATTTNALIVITEV